MVGVGFFLVLLSGPDRPMAKSRLLLLTVTPRWSADPLCMLSGGDAVSRDFGTPRDLEVFMSVNGSVLRASVDCVSGTVLGG